MSGWIKYHRKSLDNPLFKKPDIWHYWEYCLLKANHDPSKIIWNQKELVVERGSFITGRKVAAQATGLTERKIRTAITTLVNLGMISINKQKSTSKFSYLTICNYNIYNDNNTGGDQQATSKRPASDQQATTNKNVKNDKNEKKVIYNYETNNFENITEKEIKQWSEAYPALSISHEILKAGVWLDSNPKNRKINLKRFLSNWFSRAQDRAPRADKTEKPNPFKRLD